jgi:hypothetical protein
MKRRITVFVVAAAVVVGLVVVAPVFGSPSGVSSGSPSQWNNIQVGVTYRLYQPGKTLGFKLNSKIKSLSCGKGHEIWVAATYGTYKGSLGSNTKGFALYEGHPICSNPAESTKVGSPTIQGVKARLGVYCTPPKKCTAAQGVKNGFTLQWTAKPSKPYKKTTQMQLDTAKLTMAQLLTIAKGLKPA